MQEKVEQDRPHVGVAIALAADSGLQKGGAILHRLAVDLPIDVERAKVDGKRGEQLADHDPLVEKVWVLLTSRFEGRKLNQEVARLERLVNLVDELIGLFSGAGTNGEVIGISGKQGECGARR